MSDLGLSGKNIEQIKELISSFDFVSRAVVFGSRAKGTYKKYSDVDICLFGKMDRFDAERVKSALCASNMIYEFDVVCYDWIKNEALRNHIDRVGAEIYARSQSHEVSIILT